MDLRLDFFNSLNQYTKELTEDDALLVLSHNKRDGDCITLLSGDWQILSSLFSIKGYVNLTEGNQEQFNNIKNMILNTAFNICASDIECRDKLSNALNVLKRNQLQKGISLKNRYSVYEKCNLNSKVLREGNNKQELKKYCIGINKSPLLQSLSLYDNHTKSWVII
jgi:hypothetical protein